jgi:hypothetical protein
MAIVYLNCPYGVILIHKDKKFWEKLFVYFSLIQHELHRKPKSGGENTDRKVISVVYAELSVKGTRLFWYTLYP